MVSMIAFWAYFVLAFFQTGCPGWGDAILVETRGCPNLYKEAKTFVSFYDPSEMEPHTNGRGQCAAFGTIKCWPLFKQPVYEDTGEDATYYYRQWVAKVDEMVVIFPEFEEPTCDISGTLTFRAPMNSGKCLKPTPTNQDDCESISWFWNPFSDSCQENAPPGCNLLPEVCENGQWSFEWCGCVDYNTPIVVDLNGNGFNLTSAADGVAFDLNNIGGKEKLAWTSVSFIAGDVAWFTAGC